MKHNEQKKEAERFSWGTCEFLLSSGSASIDYRIGGDANIIYANKLSVFEAIEILEEVLKTIKEKELQKGKR